jgi:hypothetical protein
MHVARITSTADDNGRLVLIDRAVDALSIVASQFGYQATLDETLGIHNGMVKKTQLSSEDAIFLEIRGRNFAQVSEYFKSKAETIQEVYKEKERLKEISDLHDYMEKFKATQALHGLLTAHVNLAKEASDVMAINASVGEEVLELEDAIISGRLSGSEIFRRLELLMEKGTNLEVVMKLAMVHGIIVGNVFDKNFVKSFLANYGVQMLALLENAEKASTLCSRNFWKIKDAFDLVPEGHDDLAEGYAGYVPLTVRLIQRLGKWREQTEALNLLNGPVLEIRPNAETRRKDEDTSVVVCFLGGATYGEINALRVLAEKQKIKISILTTEIINCKSFFNSLAEL